MKGRGRLAVVASAIGLAVVGAVAFLPQGNNAKPGAPGKLPATGSTDAAQHGKDVAQAMDAMRKAVDAKPDDFQARMAYAAALGQSRKYGEAMDQLRVAGQLNPKSAEPHLAMSEIFDVAYMLDMSLAAARRAGEVEPGNVRALTRLGQLLIGLDWNMAALRTVSDAVRQHPEASSLWVVLALVKYQMNDFRGALDAVGEAQKRAPDNRALDGTLIDIHLKMGNPEKALQSAQVASRWQPEATVPLLGQAKALRALRRYDEAEKAALAALERDPESDAARYDRALTLIAMGRHSDAVPLLEPLVEKNPLFERASVNLADAYARLGKRAEATKVNRRFQQLEKGNDEAVRALMRVGNQPDDAEAHRGAGRAHLAQGRAPRAVVEFAEAMRLRPSDQAVREELAKALEAMQRDNEARAVRGTAGETERKQP